MAASTENNSCLNIACSLSTPEFHKRRETVVASLRQDALDVRETERGYAYKFAGGDEVLERLVEFIRTERQCCPFFTFTLTIGSQQSDTWLELSGPDGTKEFIRAELGIAV